jgi:c-di-GMP-binding flagellar brake protein YcgR
MIPVRKNDIALGRPLPWPVFDGDRRLLLRAGFTIETEAQLAELSRRGLYRAPGLGGLQADADSAAASPADHRDAEKWQSLQFEELRLPLGTRLSVQKLDPDDDTRYNARLHGVFKDVSFVVNIPAPGGSLAVFKQGQPLLLRAFSGTSVFAFTASVLVARYVPAAYLHLEYPRYVECTEVRARKRVNVRLIATTYRENPDGTEHSSRPAQVSDLSSGGARLVARDPLGEQGEELALAFRLKTAVGEATLKLHGTIRSIAPQEDGSGHSHGMQFVRIEPMDLLALEGYVARAALAERDTD